MIIGLLGDVEGDAAWAAEVVTEEHVPTTVSGDRAGVRLLDLDTLTYPGGG